MKERAKAALFSSSRNSEPTVESPDQVGPPIPFIGTVSFHSCEATSGQRKKDHRN